METPIGFSLPGNMPGDPNMVHRVFWSVTEHINVMRDGRRRLASSLFKTHELSLDDGAVVTAEQSSDRYPRKPNGVAAVPKAAFAVAGLELRPDAPADPEFRPEHLTAGPVTGGQAKRLRDASRIALQMPGVDVVDGDPERANSK